MANYLVAKVNSSTTSYSLRNTEPSKPYLRVSNSYLPLTTQTKTGLQVKVNDNNYNIQESYTTTVSSISVSINTYTSYWSGSQTANSKIQTTIASYKVGWRHNGYYYENCGITFTIDRNYSKSFTISIFEYQTMRLTGRNCTTISTGGYSTMDCRNSSCEYFLVDTNNNTSNIRRDVIIAGGNQYNTVKVTYSGYIKVTVTNTSISKNTAYGNITSPVTYTRSTGCTTSITTTTQ